MLCLQLSHQAIGTQHKQHRFKWQTRVWGTGAILSSQSGDGGRQKGRGEECFYNMCVCVRVAGVKPGRVQPQPRMCICYRTRFFILYSGMCLHGPVRRPNQIINRLSLYLSLIQDLCYYRQGQVLVVTKYLNRIYKFFIIHSLLFKSINNSQQLLIIDIII